MFEAFRKFVQTFSCRPFTARFFHSSLEPGCLSERELKRTCAHSGEFLHHGKRWTDTGLSLQEGPVGEAKDRCYQVCTEIGKKKLFQCYRAGILV